MECVDFMQPRWPSRIVMLGNVGTGSCEEIIFRANNAIARLASIGGCRANISASGAALGQGPAAYNSLEIQANFVTVGQVPAIGLLQAFHASG
jgi:hypothetical protein